MALSAEQIDLLTEKYIVGLYSDLEREVTGDIARRLRKAERFTETAELQAKFMSEQGFSPVKIRNEVMKMVSSDPEYQKFLAENTKEYKQMVKKEIAETVKKAQKAGNKLVAEAGTMAWNDDLQMWAEHGVDLAKPSSLSQLMTAFKKQTSNELKNISRTTGFKNTTLGQTGVLNAFQREIDLAILKTASGTFSAQAAVNDCIRALAQSGLRTIDYSSGRSYNLDTAARMIVRTSVSQLAGKVTEMNIEKTGVDLVYVDAHAGARPEHAEWQGKVYTYSGAPSRKYPDFRDSTGYGTAAGLKGVNCTHNFYPYWEGASVLPEYHDPEPVKIDGKEYTMYEATQKQRQMERQIRALKREKQAQIDSGKPDSDVIGSLNSKISEKTAEYRKFSAAAGLRAKPERMTVSTGSGTIGKKKAAKTKTTTKSKKKPAAKWTGAPNGDIAKGTSKEYYEGLVDAVNKGPVARVKKLWQKFEEKIGLGSTTTPSRKAHHTMGRIYLNTVEDAVGSSYEAPFAVMFHEGGHNIDYLCRTPNTLSYLSGSYKGGAFSKTIKEEVNNKVDELGKEIKALIKTANETKDFQPLVDKGIISQWKLDLYKRTGSFEYYKKVETVKYSKSMAYSALEKEVNAYPGKTRADLSDMLEGATNGRVSCGYGHGKKYWSGGIVDHLATEAFAEMTAASMVNPESLALIQRYLPESYKIYCEMVDSVL